MSNILDLIKSKTIVGLAPMDGITDEPFRLVMDKFARPDIYFTEFVNAEGLSRGGVKLYDQLLFSKSESPIIGQLFGKTPECFYKSAIVLSELGFDGIDINMGCQAKRITQHGSGGALINQPDLAAQIIASVKKGVDDWYEGRISVADLGLNQKTLDVITRNRNYTGKFDQPQLKPTISVKTRLGVDKIIASSWIPFILEQGIDILTIHGRIVTQGHGGGVANWEEISKVGELGRKAGTIVWGNGDVQTRQQALSYSQKYQVDGVLIGRAVIGNPWVFTDHLANFQERFDAMVYHAQCFIKIFPSRRFDPLRHHFLAYASGHPHAKELRQKLVQLTHIDQLLSLEAEFVS